MCRLPWSRHHSALAPSWRSTKVLSAFLVSTGEWGSVWSGMRRTHLHLSRPSCFFTRVGSKKKSSAWGRERRRRCQELREPPPKCPSLPGCVLPGETSQEGLRACPAHPRQPFCALTERLGAHGTGEGGISFPVRLCRPALFSPSAHPRGNVAEGWEDPVGLG